MKYKKNYHYFWIPLSKSYAYTLLIIEEFIIHKVYFKLIYKLHKLTIHKKLCHF